MPSAYPYGLSRSQRSFLKSVFSGPQQLLLSDAELHIFNTDSSRLTGRAWAVVRPTTREQVERLLKWADDERVPIVPRSRGTGMAGGSVPHQGGIVVSLSALNDIRIYPEQFVAEAGPGAVTADVQRRAEEVGLFYPPDPASSKVCSIGGNVATNAGGMRALRYGVTADYVLGLEAVLPGGRVLTTGSLCHKNAVGLNLTKLFVGSEGTLGIVTKVVLKLLPKPAAQGSVLAVFAGEDMAATAGAALLRSGVLPSALELLGERAVEAVRRAGSLAWGEEGSAVLLARLDGGSADLAVRLSEVEAFFREQGPVLTRTASGEEEEALWEVRRKLSQASYTLAPHKLSEDVTVPRGRVPELLSRVRDLSRRKNLPIITFGHLGDGNIHTNIMYDADDPGQSGSAGAVKEELSRIVLGLGGTLSGEHGVGIAKLSLVGDQLREEERRLMLEIKEVFDPNGIMNPGKAY